MHENYWLLDVNNRCFEQKVDRDDKLKRKQKEIYHKVPVLRKDIGVLFGMVLILIAISQYSTNPFGALLIGAIGLWMVFG